MPGSTRRSGTFSPPLSSGTSYSHSVQPKLNIVSRLAIEGKAKKGVDGASIKLYLKLSVPVESVSAGLTVPLFPEENVKLRDFQVHPIDASSVPYDFSSKDSPLLHNAARALKLPPRSNKTYLSLFSAANRGPFTPSTSRTNGNGAPALEESYTGYFVVSGYHVCYVLPKEFPPNYKIGNALDSDDDASSSRSGLKTPYRNRGNSISEKVVVQFMAGLDIWVPYLSKPEKYPYLLSIPIPRCLSNTIKVQIFHPVSVAASFASLSSEEDAGAWDLTTDPHVTRTSTHPNRSNPYNHFADDESSDSSVTGFSEGSGIQGTFTSSDCIKLRWALPMKSQDSPDHGDGRRRVGVADVRGDMTCTVLGKDADGVRMRIDYSGTCKDVWYPGVATMLGMDVVLDTRGCNALWPIDVDQNWQVDGGPGLTGFDIGSPNRSPSRPPSMDFPKLTVQAASPLHGAHGGRHSPAASRNQYAASSASLLRAPLPQQNLAHEYSFENSSPTSSVTPSAIESLTPSSSVLQSEYEQSKLPSAPITLHININELLPSTKNTFTFNISGTILLLPPSHSSRDSATSTSQTGTEAFSSAFPLPTFRVLTAEKEDVTSTVRSHCESSAVDVLTQATGSRHSTRRTVTLQSGMQTKIGLDSGSIILKPLPKVREPDVKASLAHSKHVASKGGSRNVSLASQHIEKTNPQQTPYREGLLIIPWVTATVVPLLTAGFSVPPSCAVTLRLPAPLDGPSEWLEFGLAMPPSISYDMVNKMPPEVHVVSASVFGVPVRFETFGSLQRDLGVLPSLEADGAEKKKWLTWVRICCGGGGELEILYTVRLHDDSDQGMKGKGKHENMNIFLPLFPLPVARMEVTVDRPSEREMKLQSNMIHQQHQRLSSKFFVFDLEPLLYNHLAITYREPPESRRFQSVRQSALNASSTILSVVPTILTLILLLCIFNLSQGLQRMKQPLESCAAALSDGPVTSYFTTTVTTTVHAPASSGEKWWFAETSTVPDSTGTATPPARSTLPPMQQPPGYYKETHSIPPKHIPEPVAHEEPTSILPYTPFAWPEDLRIEFDRLTRKMMGFWERFRGLVRIVLHWPLSPDD